jgi:hypothetical protein
MNKELIKKYPKLQGMTNESINKSIELHESFIQEMFKLYSDDFEKRYIKRILGSNWSLDTFNDEFFSVINTENLLIKFEFDNTGDISIDTFDLFGYNLILLNDADDIEILKAIIKLHEKKSELKEFLCKFINAIEPMYESIRILKTALK